MGIRYYHRDGTEGNFLDVILEWEAGNSVASDELGEYWVSTIWLFFDHGFGAGDPVRFETMVFKGGDMSGLECRRYTTEAAALAGHAELVEQVRLLSVLFEPPDQERSE